MPIIVIDGPEKAGKTTLVKALLSRLPEDTLVRKFGRADNYDTEHSADWRYREALLEDHLDLDRWVIYDRSWISDVVYDTHYSRDTRLFGDPFLAEWLYGRLARTIGVVVILLGPDIETLAANRTSDDLDIDVYLERDAFRRYGEQMAVDRVIANEHTMSAVELLAPELITLAMLRTRAVKDRTALYSDYVGPVQTPILFVGSRNKGDTIIPGAFLPCSELRWLNIARKLGCLAFMCGWNSALTVKDQELAAADLVVTMTDYAAIRVEEARQNGHRIREHFHYTPRPRSFADRILGISPEVRLLQRIHRILGVTGEEIVTRVS